MSLSKLHEVLKKWRWLILLAGGGGAACCCSGCELLGLQSQAMKPASCQAPLDDFRP